jgi:hypothetical protein
MKRILLILLVALGLGAGVTTLSSSAVFADAKSEVCGGVNAAAGGTGCTADAGITALIATIVNIFSWIVGVLAVIMIIYAGFSYVSSGGDSSKIATAKNTLIYAIIGIIVVAFSQIIVKFVLGKVTA